MDKKTCLKQRNKQCFADEEKQKQWNSGSCIIKDILIINVNVNN